MYLSDVLCKWKDVHVSVKWLLAWLLACPELPGAAAMSFGTKGNWKTISQGHWKPENLGYYPQAERIHEEVRCAWHSLSTALTSLLLLSQYFHLPACYLQQLSRGLQSGWVRAVSELIWLNYKATMAYLRAESAIYSSPSDNYERLREQLKNIRRPTGARAMNMRLPQHDG